MNKDDFSMFIRNEHIKHYGLVELIRASRRFSYDAMNERMDNICRTNNKRKNAHHRLKARDVLMVLLAGNFTCVYCDEYHGLKITIDHIKPLGKRGKNILWNLVPACSACNHEKNDMLLSEYALKKTGKETAFKSKVCALHRRVKRYKERDKEIDRAMKLFFNP